MAEQFTQAYPAPTAATGLSMSTGDALIVSSRSSYNGIVEPAIWGMRTIDVARRTDGPFREQRIRDPMQLPYAVRFCDYLAATAIGDAPPGQVAFAMLNCVAMAFSETLWLYEATLLSDWPDWRWVRVMGAAIGDGFFDEHFRYQYPRADDARKLIRRARDAGFLPGFAVEYPLHVSGYIGTTYEMDQATRPVIADAA